MYKGRGGTTSVVAGNQGYGHDPYAEDPYKPAAHSQSNSYEQHSGGQYYEEGGYYDENGQYYDENGQYYDENGQYYEQGGSQQGGYYDENGQYYDENGQYYDQSGQYYEEGGQSYGGGDQYYGQQEGGYNPNSAYVPPTSALGPAPLKKNMRSKEGPQVRIASAVFDFLNTKSELGIDPEKSIAQMTSINSERKQAQATPAQTTPSKAPAYPSTSSPMSISKASGSSPTTHYSNPTPLHASPGSQKTPLAKTNSASSINKPISQQPPQQAFYSTQSPQQPAAVQAQQPYVQGNIQQQLASVLNQGKQSVPRNLSTVKQQPQTNPGQQLSPPAMGSPHQPQMNSQGASRASQVQGAPHLPMRAGPGAGGVGRGSTRGPRIGSGSGRGVIPGGIPPPALPSMPPPQASKQPLKNLGKSYDHFFLFSLFDISGQLTDLYSPQNDEYVGHVHKEGFLKKRGLKRKNWKKRYFVLHDKVLSYYKNKEVRNHKDGKDWLNYSHVPPRIQCPSEMLS